MKAILINYNHDPQDWWLEYGFKPEDVSIYDRSDDGVQRTFAAKTYKTRNMGDVDYDKLSYLVENYDNLPERFLWSKSNIFKFVTPEALKVALSQDGFVPLLKSDHKAYSDQFGVVCKYQGPIYAERNDSWYFNNPDLTTKVHNWTQWADMFNLPKEQFIPFAPGGSYILTRERVHRFSRDLYEAMRSTLDYAMHPAEAHACERSYFYLWR